ncbi:MAG: hypothetical protein QM679_01975 [Patulibacter sp.]
MLLPTGQRSARRRNVVRTLQEQRAASSEQRAASSEQRAARSEQRAARSAQRAARSAQRAASSEPVFETFSLGLATGRDAWVNNFSSEALRGNVERTITAFNERSRALRIARESRPETTLDEIGTADSTRFSWNRNAVQDAARGKSYDVADGRFTVGCYRPFTKQRLYFGRQLNAMVYQLPKLFPTAEAENVGFFITSIGAREEFSVLAVPAVPDLNYFGTGGQFFPRWRYEPADPDDPAEARPAATLELFAQPLTSTVAERHRSSANPQQLEAASPAPGQTAGAHGAPAFAQTADPHATPASGSLPDAAASDASPPVVDGYRRVDNISDGFHAHYREAFGEEVAKDDIFYAVYAILHSPQYRETFAADLKKMLPRIPQPARAEDFFAFADAGRRLAKLHTGYEQASPYPLTEEDTSPDDIDDYARYAVTKMRFGRPTAEQKAAELRHDRSTIIYNQHVTLRSIPDEAYRYQLGSRSAVEWIIDRYQVKTDKASGIVNDPNDWSREVGDPRYIIDLIGRVITVSLETMAIVDTLPQLPLGAS